MLRHHVLKTLLNTYINLYLLEASKIAMPPKNRPRQKHIALYTVKPKLRS